MRFMAEYDLNEVLRTLKDHETRLSKLEGTKPTITKEENKTQYNINSTRGKIMFLIEEGFFNSGRSIKDIIFELKTKDYHMKSPDLTLPLRKMIHEGILTRKKTTSENLQSKNWLYKKA